MENYTLKNDETLLYRGSAIIMPDGKNEDKNAQKSDVLLTNFNIVVFQTKKKFFKTTTEPVIYNVSDEGFSVKNIEYRLAKINMEEN